MFDKVCVYGLDDLDPLFRQHHSFDGRGCGYWVWKPQVVRQTLALMADNDILVYADAGCELNPHGLPRLMEYFEMVRQNPIGIMGFEIPHRNISWTKMDVLDAMSFTSPEHHKKNQIAGGIFVLRKTPASVAIVTEWWDWCQNRHMIDDSPSILPNDHSFHEHRHDQSIWTILLHKNRCLTIPDETWDGFPKHHPIWAKRKH